MGTRLCPQTNRVSEILTLQSQWLNPINVGNSYCTKAVGDHRISMNISSFVVNLEHFRRVGIVIDRHSRVTDYRHAANLTRMEPANMNMGRHPICKYKVEMGDIVDMPLE